MTRRLTRWRRVWTILTYVITRRSLSLSTWHRASVPLCSRVVAVVSGEVSPKSSKKISFHIIHPPHQLSLPHSPPSTSSTISYKRDIRTDGTSTHTHQHQKRKRDERTSPPGTNGVDIQNHEVIIIIVRPEAGHDFARPRGVRRPRRLYLYAHRCQRRSRQG